MTDTLPTDAKQPMTAAEALEQTPTSALSVLHILRNPHGYSEGVVRAVRLAAADRIEQLERSLSTAIARAQVPEGWPEALRYLYLSTAPDGQWADQAVHGFIGAMLAAVEEPK